MLLYFNNYFSFTFLCYVEYSEDDNSFGVIKKGRYFPSSDFSFKLLAEVICPIPANSGYLIHLTPAGGKERLVSCSHYCIISALVSHLNLIPFVHSDEKQKVKHELKDKKGFSHF